MSVTVDLDENESVLVSDQYFEVQPPDRVDFVAEGIITMTKELLGKFEGTALKPAELVISTGDSRTVTVDLTGDALLQLQEIDVGVETPDADGISPGRDSLTQATEAARTASQNAGSIAFTIEGAIQDVPEETFERLSEGPLTLERVTFAVADAVRSDGGADTSLLEFSLLGFSIVVHSDGLIEIGTRGGVRDVGLP